MVISKSANYTEVNPCWNKEGNTCFNREISVFSYCTLLTYWPLVLRLCHLCLLLWIEQELKCKCNLQFEDNNMSEFANSNIYLGVNQKTVMSIIRFKKTGKGGNIHEISFTAGVKRIATFFWWKHIPQSELRREMTVDAKLEYEIPPDGTAERR